MTDQDDGKPVDGTNLCAAVFNPFDGSFHIVTNAIPRGTSEAVTTNPLHKKTYPLKVIHQGCTLADLLIELELTYHLVNNHGVNPVLSRGGECYDVPKYLEKQDPTIASKLLEYCKSNLNLLFEDKPEISHTTFLVNFTKLLCRAGESEETPLEQIIYSPQLQHIPHSLGIRYSAYDVLMGIYAMEQMIEKGIIVKEEEAGKENYLLRN